MAIILTSTEYTSTFSTPRSPLRHQILRRPITAWWRRLWSPLEAIALWDPRLRFDLLHTFNKVPLFNRPWMVSFESVLPRALGPGSSLVRNPLRERLLLPNCKFIIALSEYAVRRTRKYHDGWNRLDDLLRKIQLMPPNISVQSAERQWDASRLDCVFVGNHFARKGGIAFLRTARLAFERKLPARFHVISRLELAGNIYTDAPDKQAYAPDLKLLELPNVTVHGFLSNSAVLDLLRRSQLLFLTTLHDTFGFSVLEGLSCGTPAVATDVCALGEVARDLENAFVVSLPKDDVGDWIHLKDRHSPAYWSHLNDAFDLMAHRGLAAVEASLNDPSHWHAMSRSALDTIRSRHDSAVLGARLEQLYSDALA